MNKILARIIFLIPLFCLITIFDFPIVILFLSSIFYYFVEKDVKLRNTSLIVATFFMILKGSFFTTTIIGSLIYSLFPVEPGGQVFIDYMETLRIIELSVLSIIILFPEYVLKIFVFQRFNQYLSSVKVSPTLPPLMGLSTLLMSLISVSFILAVPSSSSFLLITSYVVLFFLYKAMVNKTQDKSEQHLLGSSKVKKTIFKLLKFSAIFTGLIILLSVGCYYSFVKEEIESKKAVDRNDIEYVREEILGKDSENRGYSDKAKEYMGEDLTVFNNDEKMRKWYTKMLIYNRRMILSDTKEAYVKNFLGWSKSSSCMISYKIDNENFKDLNFKYYLSGRTLWETKKEPTYSRYLSGKYEREMTYDERSSMVNDHPTDQECLDYLN